MGYPIQPVNEETAEFVLNTFSELVGEVRKETDCRSNVKEYLKSKIFNDSNSEINKILNNSNDDESITENSNFKKPLKVYQRKKPKLSNTNKEPKLEIIVEPNSQQSLNCGTKDFSVRINENNEGSNQTVINVPVPVKMINNNCPVSLT